MRLRKGTPLDPVMAEELAAVDAALRGDPVAPGHQELRDLVLAVRDAAPQARPEFLGELEDAVEAGFPPRANNGRGHHRPHGRPRAWARAASAAAAIGRGRSRAQLALAGCGALGVLVAGVVGVGLLRGGGGSPTPPEAVRRTALPGPRSPATPESAQLQSTGGHAGVAPRLAPVAPSSAPASPAASPALPGPRRVQRGASLTLDTPAHSLSNVADQVVGVTDRLGGIVRSSEVSSGDSATGQATFDLSIPAGRLDTALAELSQLAHVRSRQQSTLDVTDSYDTLRQRLQQQLAQRQSLLHQLARAGTRRRARAIRQQLRPLQQRIRSEQRDLAGLDRSTRYADVGVVVQATAGKQGAAAWTTGRALHDALRVLAVTLGVILVALAALVPLALVVALLVLALRAGRRRAREQALEHA